MHREKPAFNAGEQKKENRGIPRKQNKTNRGIPRGTEQDKPTYRPGNRTRQTAEYRGRQDKIITIKRKEKKKMAKITMMSGIASISGRVGNCCFRTMKATGKVYMHQVKGQRDKVQRTKEPSEAMIRQRKRFSEIAKMVMQMKAEGSQKSRKQLWKIATKAYDAENQ